MVKKLHFDMQKAAFWPKLKFSENFLKIFWNFWEFFESFFFLKFLHFFIFLHFWSKNPKFSIFYHFFFEKILIWIASRIKFYNFSSQQTVRDDHPSYVKRFLKVNNLLKKKDLKQIKINFLNRQKSCSCWQGCAR